MNEKQDIVAVSLHQSDSSAKKFGNKVPQKPKLPCRIKDVTNSQDFHIYKGIDKYILYTLFEGTRMIC